MKNHKSIFNTASKAKTSALNKLKIIGLFFLSLGILLFFYSFQFFGHPICGFICNSGLALFVAGIFILIIQGIKKENSN